MKFTWGGFLVGWLVAGAGVSVICVVFFGNTIAADVNAAIASSAGTIPGVPS